MNDTIIPRAGSGATNARVLRFLPPRCAACGYHRAPRRWQGVVLCADCYLWRQINARWQALDAAIRTWRRGRPARWAA